MIEFVQYRINREWMSADELFPHKQGQLSVGDKIDIDGDYATFIKVGDVFIEIGTSEWGTLEVLSKEEMDKVQSRVREE